FILHGTLLQVLHWRFLLIITSVPAFVTALIFFIGRPEPADAGVSDMPVSRDDGEGDAGAVSSPLPKWIFGVFLASVFTRNITFVAVLNFIPTFLVFEVGVNPAMGAYASGFFFAGAMVFSVLGGRTGDRWGAFPALLVLTVLIAVSVALIGVSLPEWAYFLLTFLFGCGVGGAFPPQHMILTKLSGERGSGESFGIVLAGMTLISASGPLLIGRLGDSIRLGNAILLFALPAAASVLLLLVLTSSRHVRGLHREMVEAHSRLRPPFSQCGRDMSS
ncbi:MAG: MFS transporter, partial [Spirochaetia bacterium]